MSDGRPQVFNTEPEPGPGDRIGDYEVLSEVARGGMATVLAVRDTRTGETRGLKLLLPLGRSNETRARFRREFRSLLRLDHPNVLRVFEWGMLDERPWFTMELLEGHDLRTEVDRLQELPPAERFAIVEDLVKQIARALSYVHERGLVHRDVTPGNVMVASDGTARLMDFGVVKEIDADLTAVGELIGTAAYMAPEQISGDAVDARADLYSLGAVMYLLLTGRRPFQAHTLHGFLEKHLNAAPRPPRELAPEIPEHLEEICLRLLQKAPADRFASASHLLYALGDRAHGMDARDRWPPHTVGRTQIRARVREVLEEVAQGRPGRVLLLCGAAGLGKSRLIALAEEIAKTRGLPVAVGRCRLQDRPFGAFASVYRSLRGSDPPPLLDAVFRGGDDGRPIDRYPVLAAFQELVVDRSPVAILLDDIERADPATLELLTFLIRNSLELSDEPVLFILTHEGPAIRAEPPPRTGQGRSRTTPPGPPPSRPSEQRIRTALEEMETVEAIELAPLDAAEVEELVVGTLGADAAAMGLANRLIREGEGSPAFIVDMLRGLIDDGLIVEEGSGLYRLTVDETQITQSHLPMPPSLRHALQERLRPLSEDALAVGRVLALARRRIELDVLVDAVPFPEERVMEALDALIDAGIVAEHRAADQEMVELSHGRFREVLLEKGAAVRSAHQRLAEALERHHRGQLGAVVEELAYQFERAELWPKAYRYLVSSANRHLQRSLYREALALLEKAVSMEPHARPFMLLDSADRRLAEVWLSISRARHGLGQLPEAVAATTEAQRLARLVRDAGLESRVSSELGTQLRQQGRVEEAEAQLANAISRAEEAGDQTLLPLPMYELGATRWSRGDLEGAERHWKRSLQIAQQVGDERARGHGVNGLAILAICRGQAMEARRHLEQSAAIFERLGMLGSLVVARANLIELHANTGVLRKALSLADRTLSQSEDASFPQGIALGRGWRARVLVCLGRLDEAVREAEAALSIVCRLEIREDEAMVRCALVEAALAHGDAEDALRRIRPLQEVLAFHDAEGIRPEVRAWEASALARLGRLDEAREVMRIDLGRAEPWPHIQVRIDLATGRALLDLGCHAEARAALQRALALAEANGFRYFQMLAHLDLHRVEDDPSVRDRHRKVAAGIARALAANLPGDDMSRFLAHHGVDEAG